MQNNFNNPAETVIINAMNIGKKFHGIGVYSYNIINELTKLKTNINFIVILNKSCHHLFDTINIPENFKLHWVTSAVSSDNKFKGHLLRLIYSNLISIQYKKFLIFNTSQMEVNFFRSSQVVTVHDIIPLLFRKYHHKQYFFFKILLNFGLKKARFIITPSYHSKEMLQTNYKIPDSRIKVIHNGADTSVAGTDDPVAGIPDKFILYLGRINKMKNIKSLLMAYHKLLDRIDHKLVVVGNDKTAFCKEIKSSEISFPENRIYFMENITDAQKNYILSKASLIVFPSLYEGFGLPPIEAMAKGCPVIVSDNSSLPEVCGDAAVYINPEDPDDIAETIYAVLGNKDLLRKMSVAGVKRAQLFNWYLSGRMHLSTIESVILHNKFPAEEKLAPVFSLLHNQNKIASSANY